MERLRECSFEGTHTQPFHSGLFKVNLEFSFSKPGLFQTWNLNKPGFEKLNSRSEPGFEKLNFRFEPRFENLKLDQISQ